MGYIILRIDKPTDYYGFAIIFLTILKVVFGDIPVSNCNCMEYWQCTMRRGQISSYCGISDSEVCCFLNTTSKSLATENGNEFEKEFECGIQAVPVVLNSKGEFREWPWHVALLQIKDDLYLCGGAIIARDKIITGAHCVIAFIKSNSPQLKIRAGEFDVSGNDEPDPHVEVIVKRISVHPKFNENLENDIAILHLSQSLNFRDHIRPLCLPLRPAPRRRSRININKTCVATGWGRTSEESNHSTVLKEVIVKLWASDKCERRLQRHFGSKYKLPSTSICGSSSDKRSFNAQSSICDGDGGGPLMCLDSDVSPQKWNIEGIVSFGIGCNPKDLQVFTRVLSYINWIRNST